MSWPRVAPIEARTAISFSREVARARSRLATLLQAIRSSMVTAPIRAYNMPLKSPTTLLARVATCTVNLGIALLIDPRQAMSDDFQIRGGGLFADAGLEARNGPEKVVIIKECRVGSGAALPTRGHPNLAGAKAEAARHHGHKGA